MLDVVANHVGPVGYTYTSINPFNSASHYHDCTPCPSDCSINFSAQNQQQIELCRLASLPDLNQTVPFVSSTLLSWIKNIISTYNIDGLRIDTVPEVPKDFWNQFTPASGVFTVGEVFDSRISYVAGYQGPVSSTLSYPLYFSLTNGFARKQSLNQIQTTLQQYNQYFSDVSILGTFLENHDNPRFLNIQSDKALYKAALTFTVMAAGIPIIYYGAEQSFHGGADPNNREALWTSNFNTNAEIYQFLKQIITFRKAQNIQSLQQIQRYSDDNFYAFTRGNVFVATTNVGSNGNQIVRTITYHPYANGTKICNLFFPTDCVTVTNNSFQVYLNNGETKILTPSQ